MKTTTPIACFVLVLTLAASPFGTASAQNNIQEQFNQVRDKMLDAYDRSRAEREEKSRQFWEEQAARDEQRAARQEQREQQRQAEAEEAARVAAQQKAEADRLATERAAQELAARRSTLDQNLGGVSLQVGGATSPNLLPVSAAPVVNRVSNPVRAENLSADPMLATRLRQVGEQVRAGHFADARKLAESCATLYPDDPRPKAALEQIAALNPAPANADKAKGK